jgi:hypothetical protein
MNRAPPLRRRKLVPWREVGASASFKKLASAQLAPKRELAPSRVKKNSPLVRSLALANA